MQSLRSSANVTRSTLTLNLFFFRQYSLSDEAILVSDTGWSQPNQYNIEHYNVENANY